MFDTQLVMCTFKKLNLKLATVQEETERIALVDSLDLQDGAA